VPAVDAPVVARVKEAGAVVFAKTNLPRSSGDLQSYNEIFGTTNNPWDTSRVPGGSSGGPAAAVARGFTSFEIGTDIAGSIRIPSHFCGTFGLKPSFGVVSQRGYLDASAGARPMPTSTRAVLRARWADWFSHWDVLLAPVTPTPAFRHDQEGDLFTRTIDSLTPRVSPPSRRCVEPIRPPPATAVPARVGTVGCECQPRRSRGWQRTATRTGSHRAVESPGRSTT
jgi:Asp-tRNA(Asn)/Glu-tRNA(Gln) amidotransferase A subunit family amidase